MLCLLLVLVHRGQVNVISRAGAGKEWSGKFMYIAGTGAQRTEIGCV